MKENNLYPKPLPIAATKQFLSRIPSRHPMDKIHKQVNHAKSAVNNYFNGYKGDSIYHEGHGGYGWDRFAKGFDDRNAKFEHTGCEMEIYELVDGAWSLLYTIKRGDAELPWKKGELAANIEKVNRALQKKEDELTRDIRRQAQVCYDPQGIDTPTDTYYHIFETAYRAGMRHKK